MKIKKEIQARKEAIENILKEIQADVDFLADDETPNCGNLDGLSRLQEDLEALMNISKN